MCRCCETDCLVSASRAVRESAEFGRAWLENRALAFGLPSGKRRLDRLHNFEAGMTDRPTVWLRIGDIISRATLGSGPALCEQQTDRSRNEWRAEGSAPRGRISSPRI